MEIAEALEFLHGRQMAHLDVKPANVIISCHDSCKLGDFGCCRVLEVPSDEISASTHKRPGNFTFPLSNSSLHQVFASDTFNFCTDNHLLCTTSTATTPQRSHLQGTYIYRAPELLKGACPTLQCDVYSLAITMWHLHTRKTPFQGKNTHAVIFSVVTFHNRPSFDDNFDTLEGTEAQEERTFGQLVQQCWHRDPRQRLSVEGIISSFKAWLL